MGFRTTGVRLVANVSQYVRELGRSQQVTQDFNKTLDDSRVKGARMANELAGTAQKSSKELTQMLHSIQAVDAQIVKTQRTITNLAQQIASSGGNKGLFEQFNEQQKRLKDQISVRNLLPDPRVAGEAGKSFAKRFTDSFGQDLQIRLVGAAVPAMTALVPMLGALTAGAVVGGVGVGGVIGGLVLAARNPAVAGAGAELGAFLMQDLERRAARFVEPALRGITRIRDGFMQMAPELDRIFASSRFLEPLTDAFVKFTHSLARGLADAMDQADGPIEGVRHLITELGIATGNFFTALSEHAQIGTVALNEFAVAASNLIDTASGFVVVAANVYEYAQAVDTWIDKGRYWLEDNQRFIGGLVGVNDQIDLTADGFKAGSKEADAYRKATLGTATASDFATLKLAGMSDAQIGAADASGTYTAELGKAEAAAAASAAATTEAATAAQQLAIKADPAYKAMETLAARLRTVDAAARGETTALKGLSDQLRGDIDPAFALITAQNNLKTAQDKATEAVKNHGRKSKEAKAATRDLAIAALDLQGRVGDLARTGFDGKLTPSMKNTFKAAGLTKAQIHDVETQTKNAKTQLDKYAGRYKADVYATGIPGVASKLNALSGMQKALKTGVGIPGPYLRVLRLNGMATGGPVRGPGTGTSDSIPTRLSNNEHVWTAKEVTAAGGHDQVERLRKAALNRELPPGFAGGGAVRWPYPVTAARTRVPSVAEASNAVVPAVPSGGRTDDWIERVAKMLVPGIRVISKYRAGAVTLSGHPSYHSMHRAVDFEPSHALAVKWNNRYKSRTKEFISPWNNLNIHNGQRHAYTGAIYRQHSGGNAHDHIAMASGGMIREPILGFGASGTTYSFGERGPETVIPGTGGGVSVTVNNYGAIGTPQFEDLLVKTVQKAQGRGRLP